MKKLFVCLIYSCLLFKSYGQPSKFENQEELRTQVCLLNNKAPKTNYHIVLSALDLNKLEQVLTSFNSNDSLIYIAHFLKSCHFGTIQEDKKALVPLEQCFNWLKTHRSNQSKDDYESRSFLCHNFAYIYHRNLFDIEKAHFHLEKMKSFIAPGFVEPLITYYNLKMDYLGAMGNLDEALQLEDSVVHCVNRVNNVLSDSTSGAIAVLALTYLRRALIREKEQEDFDSDYAKAQYYQAWVMRDSKKYGFYQKIYASFNDVYIKIYSKDTTAVRNALNVFQKQSKNYNSLFGKSRILDIMASGFYRLKDFDKALDAVEQNEKLLNANTSLSIDGNPLQYLKVLNYFQKAQVLRAKNLKKECLTSLENAMHNMLILRQTYTSEFSAKLLNASFIEVYNEAVEIAYEMGNKQLALEYADLKKHTVLRDNLYKANYISKAKLMKDISTFSLFEKNDDLLYALNKDDSFKLKLYDLKIERLSLKTTKDTFKIDSLNDKIKNESQVYATWLDSLRICHPDLFANMSYVGVPNIEEIRKNLLIDAHSCIIEYSTSPRGILAFYITKTKFDVIALKPISKYKNAIIQHHNDMINSVTPTNDSYTLYKELLKPVLEAINDAKIYRLIIIPDYNLRHIRFDALMLKPYTNRKSIEYAVNKFCISEAQSLAIYKFQKERSLRKIGEGFEAFMAHGDNTNNLPYLTNAVKKASNKAYFDVDKPLIVKEANKSDIIAIVSHNVVNQNKERNFLLANGTTLNMYDIYTHNYFKARLGIFTNCGSDLGGEFAGDGFQSMARTLAYQIPAMLVTHADDFNDRTYGNILALFLDIFQKENQPDIALWKAKNAYLKQFANKGIGDELLPFYWANLVFVGSNSPLVRKM